MMTSRTISLLTGATMAALLLAGSALALDRRVRIVNASSHDIVSFHAVIVDKREWEDSLLGEDILPVGGSVVLNFEDGSGYCRYRFRAVFDDGKALEKNSVNVCEVGTYRYTD
jgi:hypothetical protein